MRSTARSARFCPRVTTARYAPRRRGTSDQNDSILEVGNFAKLRRQVQVGKSGNDLRDYAHYNGMAAALLKYVYPEPAASRHTIRDVTGSQGLQRVGCLLVALDQFISNAASVLGS